MHSVLLVHVHLKNLNYLQAKVGGANTQKFPPIPWIGGFRSTIHHGFQTQRSVHILTNTTADHYTAGFQQWYSDTNLQTMHYIDFLVGTQPQLQLVLDGDLLYDKAA